MEFFLNKEKDQVMKTKEKLRQKRLFRNLQEVSCPQKHQKTLWIQNVFCRFIANQEI